MARAPDWLISNCSPVGLLMRLSLGGKGPSSRPDHDKANREHRHDVVKACHPVMGKARVGPLVSLESRTATAAGARATSMQLPSGSELKVLLRDGVRCIGRSRRVLELASQ